MAFLSMLIGTVRIFCFLVIGCRSGSGSFERILCNESDWIFVIFPSLSLLKCWLITIPYGDVTWMASWIHPSSSSNLWHWCTFSVLSVHWSIWCLLPFLSFHLWIWWTNLFKKFIDYDCPLTRGSFWLIWH